MGSLQGVPIVVIALLVTAPFTCISSFALTRTQALNERNYLLQGEGLSLDDYAPPQPNPPIHIDPPAQVSGDDYGPLCGGAGEVPCPLPPPSPVHHDQNVQDGGHDDYAPPGPDPPIHINPPARFSGEKVPHYSSDYGHGCGSSEVRKHCPYSPPPCAPGYLCGQIPDDVDGENKGFNRGGSVLPSMKL